MLPAQTLLPSLIAVRCRWGKVAAAAKERKILKHANLGHAFLFVPTAIELGVFNPRMSTLVRELGRKMHLETGEEKSRT